MLLVVVVNCIRLAATADAENHVVVVVAKVEIEVRFVVVVVANIEIEANVVVVVVVVVVAAAAAAVDSYSLQVLVHRVDLCTQEDRNKHLLQGTTSQYRLLPLIHTEVHSPVIQSDTPGSKDPASFSKRT